MTESARDSQLRIRIDCLPYASDDRTPIRMVIVYPGDRKQIWLRFTPEQALDSALSVGTMMGLLLPRLDAERLANMIRSAAVKVFATRN